MSAPAATPLAGAMFTRVVLVQTLEDLSARRYRSVAPNGDVYEITKPTQRDAFACLRVNGQEMSWTRDKAELVKRAQYLAASAERCVDP